MTPEQQRIAIAKKCPFVQWKGDAPFWRDDRDSIIRFDPLTDLNAMHEAEKVLKAKGIFSSYCSALAKVCGFVAQGDEAWHKLHAGQEAVASATASQRAEAFLRTLNLYTPTPCAT